MGVIKTIFKTIAWIIRSILAFFGITWLLSLMQNKVGDIASKVIEWIAKIITGWF